MYLPFYTDLDYAWPHIPNPSGVSGDRSPAGLYRTHLDKQGNGVEPEDFHAVHGIPGEDVQGSGAALHDLLHPYTVLHEKT